MKSIPIPLSTIQAYGGTPIKIDPPKNFELDNGSPIESILGMRVGEVVYILMGVEEEEREALSRTNAFYLGFVSGFVPVFTVRVADIIHGQTDDPTETLPVLITDFNMSQEAQDSWGRLNENLAYKQIPVKTELRQEDGVGNMIVEAGDYLFLDFRTGQTVIVAALLANMLIQEEQNEEADIVEFQQPDGNGNIEKEKLPGL